jgi:hypothetical protein
MMTGEALVMKKILLLCAFILLLQGLASCRGGATPVPGERVSAADAGEMIGALLPNKDLEIEGITTDELWDEMGVQLFANKCPQRYEYVFAIVKDKALMLKEHWGAYDFEYALADMDGDGQKEMLYAYDWGSGIVRTILGVLKSDGSLEKIVPTEDAEGLWTIRDLKANGDTVAFEALSLGGSPAVTGICTYNKGEYIFDIEK